MNSNNSTKGDAPVTVEREAIERAIKATEYKYFGDYEMSDCQREAVDVLVEAARHRLTALTSAPVGPDPDTPAYEAARQVLVCELRRIAASEPKSGYGEMADRLEAGQQSTIPAYVAMQVMARQPASAPAGDGDAADWLNTLPGVKPSDQFIAADRRLFEGLIDRVIAAALARPRAKVGERYTGQGFLTPASGLDEDGMCNEHGRQGCRACVDDLLAPLAQEAAAMPYRDGVIRIIAEAGKLNEGGHADWTVHAEVFADMVIALRSQGAAVGEREA